MSGSKEELKGLPDIYLSPSRSSGSGRTSKLDQSDVELSVLDDADSEVWQVLIPEATVSDGSRMFDVVSGEASSEFSLGQREEIEGDSSIDSALNSNRATTGRLNSTSYSQQELKGSREHSGSGFSRSQVASDKLNSKKQKRGGHWKHQRGETPGADCPPVAGIGALSRVFRQPLELSTNVSQPPKSELVFSPGGDEGFMVPGGVSAYYGTGSGSDTDGLEWNSRLDVGAQALCPARDVEGADNMVSVPQMYSGDRLVALTGPEGMERNSPAGLSTPDGEIDLQFNKGKTASQSQSKSNSVRPPVVGQSEEQVQTTTRKDLGSTDGEESEDDGRQKRIDLLRDPIPTDIQLSSLGSQSENTDSVNTVLDMSRGEVQGCETDGTIDTPVISPSQIPEPAHLHGHLKPTFVVGGPIAPRGKYKMFQSTVRGRMQDMMASLDLEPNPDARMYVDRDHFLSQPPLCPAVPAVSEQEVSLTSMVSVESTHHPESSDRVTSPSVLSVSSAASSKRLEWDSGADVGYMGNIPEQISSSLSTLERIALGSYASVLRTEPEGTPHVVDKQKVSKKSTKPNIPKSSSTSGSGRRSNLEQISASLPSKSHRGTHPRERFKVSSSEEDYGGRFSSHGNSPRRRPRRRPVAANSKKLDLPLKSCTMKTKKTFGRLHQLLQEINSEGKTSSLVELNQASRSIAECRRSNSQQSLSYSGDKSGKQSETVSSVSVAAGSSTSVVTTVCRKPNRKASVAGGDSDANACSSNVDQRPASLKVGTSSDKTSENVKHLSVDSAQQRVTGSRMQRKICASSSNEVSSKSRGSSDTETLSDIKDTDLDSCPSSNLVSDEELLNAKARKISKNAKNHENIAKQHLKSGSDKLAQSQGQKRGDDSSSSNSLQRSLLESQVSIQSINNSLQALSARLKEKIQALLDSGTMKKVQDYNKLQDYVAFIGMPSTNEEECQLKQGVANVIMRMFGEMGADDTDASNNMNSETSGPQTPSSSGDSRAESMSENTIRSLDDDGHYLLGPSGAIHEKCGYPVAKENHKSDSEGHSITPSGTVKIVPYRPPSSTRTYYMAVQCNLEEGIVEGEQDTTPEDEKSLAVALTARQDDLRGQAEGHRNVSNDEESSSPTVFQAGERGEDYSLASEENLSNRERHYDARDHEDDESESISAAAALPREWDNAGRSQATSDLLPGTLTSDESSPRRVLASSAWERESSGNEDDRDARSGEDTQWKYTSTRSESLYKDKLGTLHIAKQPPGYTDDRDSHQSESTSDHEPGNPCVNDTESQEDRRRYNHPWTSSGSESAYETIRERHRHVDEALASSFEFYSTSPRDARLLGYVSSEAEREQEEEKRLTEIEEPLDSEQASEVSPLISKPIPSDEYPSQSSGKPKKQMRQQYDIPRLSKDTARFISSFSSHTDNDLSSSQISMIQLRKHRYVRRIQHYIDSLEKLERALVGQFGDSIGSEKSFQRYVTEGRSHTESDSNNKAQARDILGQSETASSSMASSDVSDDLSRRKSHQPRWRRKGVLARSDAHTGSQDVPQLLTPSYEDDSVQGAVGPALPSSLSASPRMNQSHRSTDVTSSRTSTLKQIENEVRMLARTEEKSRHVIRKNVKSKTSGSRKSRHHDMQRMRREEPRGEEDPSRSLATSRRGTLDSNVSVKYSLPDISRKKRDSSKISERLSKMSDFEYESKEESSGRDVSDSQISRRGDGRETGDALQAPRVVSIVGSPPTRDIPVSRSGSTQTLHRDFGQMFPSTLNVVSDRNVDTFSVGIQTSTSLLGLDERRKDDDDSPRAISSSRTGGKEYFKATSSHPEVLNGLERKGNLDSKKGLQHRDERSRESNRVSNSGSGRRASDDIDHNRNFSEQQESQSRYAKQDRTEICNGQEVETSTVRNEMHILRVPQEETAQESEEVNHSSNPPSLQKYSHSNSSMARTDSLQSHTTMDVRRDIGSQNVPYSAPSSGRNNTDPNLRSTISIKTAQVIQQDHNSEDCRESCAEAQNRTFHPAGDSGISESFYGSGTPVSDSMRRSGKESSTPIVNSWRSVEGATNADISAEASREEYLKRRRQPQGYSQTIASDQSESDVSSPRVPQTYGHEIPGASRNQMKARDTRNKKYADSQMGNSSARSVHNRNRTNIIENAKNRLVGKYGDNLISYKKNAADDLHAKKSVEPEGNGNLHSNRSVVKMSNFKEPVSFDVNLSDKENIGTEGRPQKSKVVYTPQGRSGVIILDNKKEEITLQEALSKARPEYLRDAGERRALIRLKQEMRHIAQSRNHEIISQIPTNLQTPSTLQRFLYKPDIAPLFSYKDIREQNRRLYQLLPEANMKQKGSNQVAVKRTNRLMANMYSQKLRNKVLKGSVSHAHKDIVSPLSVNRK